uniref:Putative secreted protein n=1 Tax=Ixodes ricinus TaxID=34613 RepID=A0A6B0UIQ8_IXORI
MAFSLLAFFFLRSLKARVASVKRATSSLESNSLWRKRKPARLKPTASLAEPSRSRVARRRRSTTGTRAEVAPIWPLCTLSRKKRQRQHSSTSQLRLSSSERAFSSSIT